MTLIRAGAGGAIRQFVSPGTENDGYLEPEWRSGSEPSNWVGGRNNDVYFGFTGNDGKEFVIVFTNPEPIAKAYREHYLREI